MFIIQEELKAKNGPSGSKFGTVIDADTNEPIATYKKHDYLKKYSLDWHPTFLDNNPEMKNSLEANSALKSGKDPENLIAVTGTVERAHARMAAKGFRDTHDVRETNEGGMTRRDYHDRDSGEHLATVLSSQSGRTAGLSSDFVAKHNIPEDIVKSTNSKLSSTRNHLEFADELDKQVRELAVKKAATGLHSFGDATTKVFHATGTPEETSSAHESELAKNGYSINRLSPSHFIATSLDGNEMVHSIAHGDKLHSVHTKVGGYSAKKLSNPTSF